MTSFIGMYNNRTEHLGHYRTDPISEEVDRLVQEHMKQTQKNYAEALDYVMADPANAELKKAYASS